MDRMERFLSDIAAARPEYSVQLESIGNEYRGMRDGEFCGILESLRADFPGKESVIDAIGQGYEVTAQMESVKKTLATLALGALIGLGLSANSCSSEGHGDSAATPGAGEYVMNGLKSAGTGAVNMGASVAGFAADKAGKIMNYAGNKIREYDKGE